MYVVGVFRICDRNWIKVLQIPNRNYFRASRKEIPKYGL